MNLAEKFKKQSIEVQNQIDVVTEEIVKYFKNIFESGRFSEVLENDLTEDEKIKRRKSFFVECFNDTQFRIDCFVWKNHAETSDQSNYYKGVDLKKIQKDIGRKLLSLTEYYLKNMGFRKWVIDSDENSLCNYRRKITIFW